MKDETIATGFIFIVAVVLVGIFTAVIYDVYNNPPPTPQEVEAIYEKERSAYDKWCRSVGGNPVYDRFKHPKECR